MCSIVRETHRESLSSLRSFPHFNQSVSNSSRSSYYHVHFRRGPARISLMHRTKMEGAASARPPLPDGQSSPATSGARQAAEPGQAVVSSVAKGCAEAEAALLSDGNSFFQQEKERFTNSLFHSSSSFPRTRRGHRRSASTPLEAWDGTMGKLEAMSVRKSSLFYSPPAHLTKRQKQPALSVQPPARVSARRFKGYLHMDRLLVATGDRFPPPRRRRWPSVTGRARAGHGILKGATAARRLPDATASHAFSPCLLPRRPARPLGSDLLSTAAVGGVSLC